MTPVPEGPAAAPRRRSVLAAPDAFKGTATAPELAEAVADGARRAGWRATTCPLSDGGEGFAEVIAVARRGTGSSEGTWNTTTVTGPLGSPVTARWWSSGAEAVIESAAASGLPLAGGREGNDPVAATTRGTGELVMAAVAGGAQRVLLGVGGSATTDGGRGAIEAIEEAGGLGEAEVVVACDVETPFAEAATQFGPQKGASPAQVAELTARLVAFAAELQARYGVDVTAAPGAGAAGGLAGGLLALGARLLPGFDVVADAVGFAARLVDADLVVTGEGRLDATSWAGKVVGQVVRAASRARRPVLVVAGSLGPGGVDGAVPDAPVPTATVPHAGWVEVRSLADRFGEARALSDPAGCLAAVVSEVLATWPGR
jgi:glycerate 2-kinase